MFTDARGTVSACVWFLEHALGPSFDDLRVRHSPLALDSDWASEAVWYAVEWDLAQARAQGLPYGEVGGWAAARDSCHRTGCCWRLPPIVWRTAQLDSLGSCLLPLDRSASF